MWKGCLAAGGVLLLSACGGVEDDCPPMGMPPPLRVQVTNADTAESLCDANVTASSSDGSEILVATTECSFIGGSGPATYDITAEKDGYEPATVSGVVVRDLGGECRRWEIVTTTIPMRPEP
jgi:hypothetical protein